jgi:hypothetical protein
LEKPADFTLSADADADLDEIREFTVGNRSWADRSAFAGSESAASPLDRRLKAAICYGICLSPARVT